jgi:hypothetical protein
VTCDQCPFALLCLGGRLVPTTHIACFECGLVRERGAGQPHIACGNQKELLARNPRLYAAWLDGRPQSEQLAHFGALDEAVVQSWKEKKPT